MQLNTLKKLEYDKIIALLCRETSFEGGRRLAEKVMPNHRMEKVQSLLEETGEAMELLRFGSPDFLQSNVLMDLHFLKLQSHGVLQPKDLGDFYHLLFSSRAMKNFVENPQAGETPRLKELAERLFYDNRLEKHVIDVVDEYGQLRDDASPALKDIRRQIASSRQRIKDYLQEFIHSESRKSMLQDALITERAGRYVVPVKQEYRYEVRGIVHDESASGATVFIEPMAVVENNNRIRQLEIQEKREIERILSHISDILKEYLEPLKQNSKLLGVFDLIFARAHLAYKMNAYCPKLNRDGVVELYRACHPLLGERCVPININLGKTFDMLVITGPNTGGKTVVLKTVGLLTLMAMSGLFIPAREDSQVAIFDRICVDVGDEQSIEQSLSTFSSHMKNVVEILQSVNSRSLVLLDELGSGTDPIEGAALGRAILENLAQRRVRAIVTTHQSELKTFAYQNPRVENACVEFDHETLKPTYQVTIGIPGQSNALEIVSTLGMSEAILTRARALLPEREIEMGDMVKRVKAKQQEYEKQLALLEKETQELRAAQAQMEADRNKLEEDRRAIIHKARVEAQDYVQDIREQANEALEEIRQAVKKNSKNPKWHEIEQSRQKLKNIELKPADEMRVIRDTKHTLQVGDQVKIVDMGQRGEVIEIFPDRKEARVQIGVIRFTMAINRLEIVEKAKAPGERMLMADYLKKVQTISPEIDIRGENGDDGIFLLDKYINDALLAGLESIRIIHGKGTGALRTAIRGHLKSLPCIKSFRDGMIEEGGAGVTVAYLK